MRCTTGPVSPSLLTWPPSKVTPNKSTWVEGQAWFSSSLRNPRAGFYKYLSPRSPKTGGLCAGLPQFTPLRGKGCPLDNLSFTHTPQEDSLTCRTRWRKNFLLSSGDHSPNPVTCNSQVQEQATTQTLTECLLCAGSTCLREGTRAPSYIWVGLSLS